MGDVLPLGPAVVAVLCPVGRAVAERLGRGRRRGAGGRGVAGPVAPPPRAAVRRARRLRLPLVVVAAVFLRALPHGARVTLGVAAVGVGVARVARVAAAMLLVVAPLLAVPVLVLGLGLGGPQLVEGRGVVVVVVPGARVGLGVDAALAVAVAAAQVAHAPYGEHQQQEEGAAHRPPDH